MCIWTNVWTNSLDAGDLSRYDTRCDVTVKFVERYAKQIKKEVARSPKVHYFSAFSVRKLKTDVDCWASQRKMNNSVCVNTLWLDTVVSPLMLMLSLVFRIANPRTVPSLTLSQWSSSGNPVAIRCAWNLDHSVHWNATAEGQCASSGLPVVFQCLSSGLPVCSNYAN